MNISLEKQAVWLARHINDVHSPRPGVIDDETMRGLVFIRALSVGALTYGDSTFHKTEAELKQEINEEWADAEFYNLVLRFGKELVPTTPVKGPLELAYARSQEEQSESSVKSVPEVFSDSVGWGHDEG